MNLKKVLVVGVLISASVSTAHAVAIDFNDGTADGLIGGFYSGLGVSFSNAEWDGYVSPNEGVVGAGGLKLIAAGNNFEPKLGNPIVGTFSSPVESVSIQGLNVGENGARIDAYDAVIGGNLIGSDEAFGTGLGEDNHPLLLVGVIGIRRIELCQPLSVSPGGLLFDNLSFQSSDNLSVSVPEAGSTIALMGVALCAVSGLSLQIRKQER